jgi:hypothetical protein
MKTKIIFSLLLILVVSCNKDKSDARKMVGTWKREFRNGMTGQILLEDTVYIDKVYFKLDNIDYNFYLKNDSLILIKDADTLTYCYKFITENQIRINCFSPIEQGLYYQLKRL